MATGIQLYELACLKSFTHWAAVFLSHFCEAIFLSFAQSRVAWFTEVGPFLRLVVIKCVQSLRPGHDSAAQ